MQSVRFYLKLSPEALLEYYQGSKKFVRVKTYAGYNIQFRAEHLRAWITHDGINGEFEITFDQYKKFKSLTMIKSNISSSPQRGKSSPVTSIHQRPRGGFKTSI